jgi:diaminopimelate decarboxylase
MEWRRALAVTLELAEKFKDLEAVNIGGGFKAKYMDGDHDANMVDIMSILSAELLSFEEKTGKKIKLEIEPGRLLVVHAGVIISKVIDITDTGKDGYSFIRTDTGMTEIIRSAMYGAQHPLVVVPHTEEPRGEKEYVVVGHCCESSDCLTTVKGDPESIEPRLLVEAKIDDYLVIEKTGAYCYGMSALGYNSFPEAPVVFVE